MRLIFFIAICAPAQVETPSIGMMLDSRGSARPVFGVAASVTAGDAVQDGVVSMACASTCVMSAQPELIAFDGDSPVRYQGDALSMRVSGGARELAVRRDDGVWIIRDDGSAAGTIPGATGAVLLLHNAVLFASGNETVLRRDDGSEHRFEIHADAFFRMSEGYVQIRSGGLNYALRLRGAKLFQLPEVSQ